MKFYIILISLLIFTQNYYPSRFLIEKSKSIQDPITDFKNDNKHLTINKLKLPCGFYRNDLDSNSFECFLSNLPLKPAGTLVKYYNGKYKQNNNVYCAVVDIDIGNKNLVQCADAIMLLRGNYLFNQKRFNDIHFNFTNGFNAQYSEWIKGKRIVIEGNKTFWRQKTGPSNTYKDFLEFMQIVYNYAGTLSLEKELKFKPIKNLNIGDIFIKGGSPGHAVIVVDKANDNKGNNIFMLAQSYMPAQEIQILINQNDSNLSPWYSLNFGEILHTPEWTFNAYQLKCF